MQKTLSEDFRIRYDNVKTLSTNVSVTSSLMHCKSRHLVLNDMASLKTSITINKTLMTLMHLFFKKKLFFQKLCSQLYGSVSQSFGVQQSVLRSTDNIESRAHQCFVSDIHAVFCVAAWTSASTNGCLTLCYITFMHHDKLRVK